MPLPQSKKNVGLGRSIINRVAKDAHTRPRSEFHTTDVSSSSKHGLASVTHQGDLESFLDTAQLAEQDFTAERRNVTVVQTPGGMQEGRTRGHNPFLLTGQEEQEVLSRQRDNKQRLRVPRRPAWDAKTTPADLARAEKDTFLEWRRNLAQLTDAQNFVLTPFERNIEVWRQLWRVLERAHLVVQIVDARNPLKFRCEDLEKYVESLGVVGKNGLQYLSAEVEGDGKPAQAKGMGPRRNLLLINKADLLDEGQRRRWAEYFDRHDIRYAFFSAANAAALQAAKAEAEELAQQQIEDEERKERQRKRREEAGGVVEPEEDSEDDDEDTQGSSESLVDAAEAVSLGARDAKPLVGQEATDKVDEHKAELVKDIKASTVDGEEDAVDAVKDTSAPLTIRKDATGKDPTRVLNVLELEELFMATAPPLDDFASDYGTPSQLTVGLVGYPNVGKSSTINALLGSKKVSVSSTPGKTKHFQTLPFSDQVTLCDCPGLVFPQFATSSGELIVDGILPIDQMREYTAPAELVAQRIPKDIVEGYYGIRVQTLDVEEGGSGTPTGLELLSAYAVARGFVRQGQGNPDESRAARYVLKDYVNAKLLYCNPPPGVGADDFNANQRKRGREALKGRRYDPALMDEELVQSQGVSGGKRQPGAKSRALDAAFFAQGNQGGAQAKGRKGTPGSGVISGRVAADGSIIQGNGAASAALGNGKKHHKGNKRGKVRYAGVHDD
ncbi:unnamed protein product [Sympodiomycopsis kandeliae]